MQGDKKQMLIFRVFSIIETFDKKRVMKPHDMSYLEVIAKHTKRLSLTSDAKLDALGIPQRLIIVRSSCKHKD